MTFFQAYAVGMVAVYVMSIIYFERLRECTAHLPWQGRVIFLVIKWTVAPFMWAGPIYLLSRVVRYAFDI